MVYAIIMSAEETALRFIHAAVEGIFPKLPQRWVISREIPCRAVGKDRQVCVCLVGDGSLCQSLKQCICTGKKLFRVLAAKQATASQVDGFLQCVAFKGETHLFPVCALIVVVF